MKQFGTILMPRWLTLLLYRGGRFQRLAHRRTRGRDRQPTESV